MTFSTRSLYIARSYTRRLAAVAALLGAAACADAPSATAPRAASGGIDLSLISTLTGHAGDTTVTQFTVDPTTSTTFQVGSGHVVYFPAYSICDPSTSSYGPTEWDKPCTPTRRPIVITAKTWIDAAGLPQVDFAPALRFSSQASTEYTGISGPASYVQIGLAVNSATIGSATDRLKILYCANPLAPCVDESLLDPTLTTAVDEAGTAVYRRIKHFSGYNVSVGRVDVSIEIPSLSRTQGTASIDAPAHGGFLMSSGRNGK